MATAPVLKTLAAPPTASVQGAAELGSQVFSFTPGWPAGTQLSFQWLRNGVTIPGATSSVYTVGHTDVGKKLSYRMTGSAAGYKAVTVTSSSVTVLNSTPAPVISAGARTPGTVLTGKHEAWVTSPPVAMRYQWMRNGTPIPGATTLSYKLTTADLNTSIVLRARSIHAGVPVATVSSVPVKPSLLKPLTLQVDRDAYAAGTTVVGNKLWVYGGQWTQAGATNTIQWLRNGTPIAGAVGAEYKLTTADVGQKVTAAVTGSLKGYADTTVEAGTYLSKVTALPK